MDNMDINDREYEESASVMRLEPETGGSFHITGPGVIRIKDDQRSWVFIWSSGSSGRAVGYQVRGPGFEFQSEPNKFIIAPPCPPITKWVKKSAISTFDNIADANDNDVSVNAAAAAAAAADDDDDDDGENEAIT
ncbi:hypothetical protein PoB_001645400 [Plakobranchus ocellatus]|uniref:Uncharacterized protein n=1 Tax=Plakobranchus ocellatus TaxID=259542 RepID=A0AAV3Z7I3_9GAST|nr:hypothetical protein PoB_001645400 [Plakobranchus ocellatus]